MSILIKDVLLGKGRTHIYIEGERISEIGSIVEADKVIDGSRMAALPGFVNTHTHAAMTLFRGVGDDMELQPWLQDKIWPMEAHLRAEDVYWGSKLACLEMIKTGTVCFNDQYFFMEETARAVDEMGLRAVLAYGFIDLSDEEKREREIKATEKLFKHVGSMGSKRIRAAVGPHAPYTVSKEGLQWARSYAEENNAIVHFHLAETEKEHDDIVEQHGKSPVRYLDGIGFLWDGLVAAHCVWIPDEDVRLMAERGVKASHNPISNMKLGVDSHMPYKRMREAGVLCSLGTDGAASNNNLDMFDSMKTAALLQKLGRDPTCLPAREALELATLNGYRTLGLEGGRIEEGSPADIILIDTSGYVFSPGHNLESDLVYAANGSCVDTTICAGRVLMEGRQVPGEADIIRKSREIARDLVKRQGGSS